MTQAKKYEIKTELVNDSWTANIVRKASSTKTIVSKTQDGFAKEIDAIAWAEEALQGFTKTQADSNVRKAKQRVDSQKISQDRSERKAAKTAEKKAQKELKEASEADETGNLNE